VGSAIFFTIASSIIVLAYTEANFPFYLLPAYPWIGSALVQLARLVKPFGQTSQVQRWVVTMLSFLALFYPRVWDFVFPLLCFFSISDRFLG
jgi:hypothetical protein